MRILFSLLVSFVFIGMVSAFHAEAASGSGTSNAVSVSHLSRAHVGKIADHIDELVTKKLDEVGQKPNAKAPDAVFVRRIYLDIVGRIPTHHEVTEFLKDSSKEKRAELIDRLLDSKGYASHHFNYWADLLRVKSRLNRQVPGQSYIDFVKHALQTNMPYDQFVHAMLTAEGPLLERGNGAVGYYLRDFQMPEDNMSNTARVFLGTRLECAQCHDHPFDKWTQRDFFEMVAFTGGVRMRPTDALTQQRREMQKMFRSGDVSQEVRRAVNRMTRPLIYGIEGSGTGLARLPDTYQYDDGKPNEIVTAKTMFEHASLIDVSVPKSTRSVRRSRRNPQQVIIPGAKEVDSRKAYAAWLTSPDNPRFTQVIANRLWKKVMGIGVIEPVDSMEDDTVASNPKLMAFLTQHMISLDYDMKQFLRTIYYSDTYQRAASSYDRESEEPYHFPGPTLRRMSAEQIWDSMLTLAVPDLDDRSGPKTFATRRRYGAEDVYVAYEQLSKRSADEIVELAKQQLELRKDPAARKKYRQQMMMADGHGNRASANAETRREIQALKSDFQKAKKNRNAKEMRKLSQRRSQLKQKLQQSSVGFPPEFVRASELPSPARPGHFLREFG